MEEPINQLVAQSRSSGGRDNIAGTNLQHLITAWGMVLMLAQKMATPPFGWPSDSEVVLIRSETEQAIDDVLIGNSDSGFAFVQAKQSLQLTNGADLPLDKSIAQFCQQQHNAQVASAYPWQQRLYTPESDRFILATTANAAGTVTRDLRALLTQIRSAGPDVPLEDSAFNQGERSALQTLNALLDRHWVALKGTLPTEDERRTLLRLIQLQVFDFSIGGTHLTQALQLLRTQILAQPEQAEAAWASLVTFAATHGELSGGVGVEGVRAELRRLGHRLLGPPDFTHDIERLRAFSDSTAEKLAPLGRLEWRGGPIRLNRTVTQAVIDASHTGSVLVTGEPGTGKSGVLLHAYQQIKATGGEALLLAVDSIGANSVGQLQQELGLQHPMVEVLRQWPDATPKVLFVDAMDAARSDERVRTLRDLINAIQREAPDWYVVASMRQFDLRYSGQIQRLFGGVPPSVWQLGEFQRLRHVAVPKFTDEEWQQLTEQIPRLQDLAQGGTEGLRTLLRSPFNVRLVTDILSSGDQPILLNAVETQAQLLDEYWRVRVTPSATTAYERQEQLLQVIQLATQQHSMRAARAQLSSGRADILAALIADGVLTEWQPPTAPRPNSNQVTFTHHLLFDEAAARLFFTEEMLVEQLRQDRELSIAYRPSIERRLQLTWDADPDRNAFWNLAVVLKATSGIPEISRFLPPLVAVQLAGRAEDFAPLIRSLQGSHRDEAITLLHMVVSSLMTSREGINPRHVLWGELAEQLIQLEPQADLTDVVRRLLAIVSEAGRDRDITDLALGRAARQFLIYQWGATNPSEVGINVGIDAVINTAGTDLAASLTLLARALEPERLQEQGFRLIPRLAHHGKRLMALDPNFVFDLFDAAFGWEEDSEERTNLGFGVLLPLTSTRRQDYSMGRYSLSELFPELLRADAVKATRVLMHALATSARAERQALRLVSFPFRGCEAQIGEVNTWDDEPYPQPYTAEQLLLTDYKAYVLTVGHAGDLTQWRDLLTVIACENRRPLVWRTLFHWAVELPTDFQRELIPLMNSIEILAGWTTRDAVGEFLRATFAAFTPSERSKIERVILSLTGQNSELADVLERARDQLLGCLPALLIEEPQARELRANLEQAGTLPPNTPVIQFLGLKDEELLQDEAHFEESSLEQQAAESVRQYVSDYYNKAINSEAAAAVLPAFEQLYQSRIGQWTSEDREGSTLSLWDRLVDAAEITARLVDELSWDDRRLALSREVLLQASTDPLPESDKSQYDQHGSWGKPSPRVEAASGLAYLLRGQPNDQTIRSAVLRLIDDPAPEVRNHAARSAHWWGVASIDDYWAALERRTAIEPSRRVLTSWLDSMHPFTRQDPQQVFTTAQAILERVGSPDLDEELHNNFIQVIADLVTDCGFYQAYAPALATLESWSRNVHEVFLKNAIWRASQLLADDNATDEERRRALTFLRCVVQTVSDEWTRHTGASTPNPDFVKRLVDLADWVSIRLLGDMAGLKSAGNDDRPPPTLPRYERIRPIIADLTPIAIPQVVHHLLDTLAHFVPVSPITILLQIGGILTTGRQYGYQFDQLITDQIVGLVRVYLADHGDELRREPDAMSTLIDILDALLESGRVDGITLALELSSLYR